MRVCLCVVLALLVSGCSTLPLAGARFDAAELSARPILLVATTRKPVSGARTKPWFGTERATYKQIRVIKDEPADSDFSPDTSPLKRSIHEEFGKNCS